MTTAHWFYAAGAALLLLASGFILSDSFGMIALFGVLGITSAAIGMFLERPRG